MAKLLVSLCPALFLPPYCLRLCLFAVLSALAPLRSFRFHLTSPPLLWVSAIVQSFKPITVRGVFNTTSRLKRWLNVLFLSACSCSAYLVLIPSNPDIVYAWLWHGQRKPWTIISGASEGGFYKSTEGGAHFANVTSGPHADVGGQHNRRAHAQTPNRFIHSHATNPAHASHRHYNEV